MSARRRGFAGPPAVAPAEKVAVAHGVVPSVEGLTFPPEFEHSFHDTALIARILIDGSPALSRPTDDLNRKTLWRVDEASISLEAMITRREEWRLVSPPHACGRHAGELRRVKIHDGWRSADSINDYI
jgi:hypothetical protein